METSLSKKVSVICSLCVYTFVSISQDYTPTQSADPSTIQEDIYSQSSYMLGSLSARWESGNRGPATISTSINDPGGASYGTYQISNKHGYVADYLKYEGAQFCDYFQDLKPGTSEFNTQWKRIAVENADEFHRAEHKFIKRTHYRPFTYRLKKYLQFDVDHFSPVMRDVIWSTAVQHGPNSQIVINALKSDDIYNLSEYEIINKIYTERSKKVNDKLYYFPRVKDHWQNHLTNRFDEERMEALAQLRKQNVNISPVKKSKPVKRQQKPVIDSGPSTSKVVMRKEVVQIKPNKPVQQKYKTTTTAQATVIRQNNPAKEQRYRILMMTLDTPDYSFDDLNENSVYTVWDERIGFYNYYMGNQLSKDVADKLLAMLQSRGYSVGKIVTHQ